MDKDGIVLICAETNKRVIYNCFSFKEILKGIMMKYGNKTFEEAKVIITEHNNFFIISGENYWTVTHELEYHWAMLWACGEGYWKNGFDYPPPSDYEEWENEYRKINKLADSSFDYLD